MRIRVCWYKNAGVAGYAEAFRPVQSDSQTSEWYSYFENDVLVWLTIQFRIRSPAPEFRRFSSYPDVSSVLLPEYHTGFL
ncbi:hypothetical protein DWW20_05470 [Ruminococcus sp. AF14-5]|nr:hypothetical protein DWW20_05470 [Ruminococcus sp. AF14-5]